MAEKIEVTGGASIGLASASYPFAKLSASAGEIRISSLLGTYAFSSAEVAALEPYGSIPFFSRGISIVHTRKEFPAKIIFWCLGSRDGLLERIKRSGFVPQATKARVPQRSGIAFRWSFVIFVFLIWQALAWLDMSNQNRQPHEPGLLALLGTFFVLMTSVGVMTSSRIRAIALKPGRELAEVRPVLRLFILVTGILSIVFAAFFLSEYLQWL